MRLYRPVGLNELALIFDANMTAFPPRLPEQPIFYPVFGSPYARQIARDWNTKGDTRAGYVTRFEVDDGYVSRFERHVVGSHEHVELWIPAEQLAEFNSHIGGPITVTEAYFGEGFAGYVGEHASFRGKNAVEQFLLLEDVWRYNAAMDFPGEISMNPKPIFLHFPFWTQHDFFPEHSITSDWRDQTLGHINRVWQWVFPNAPNLCCSDRMSDDAAV